MSLHIIQNDITKTFADAIVNSTNIHMIGFSGIDALLHKLGGKTFEEECKAHAGKCPPGEAVYTKAYNVPSKYIIHTVSPLWRGGMAGEAAILRSCYKSSLELAEELGCKSIAFPLIAAGSLEYPVHQALEIAVTSIKEHLAIADDMDVYLVLYGDVVKRIAETMYGDLDDYILSSRETLLCCDESASFEGAAHNVKFAARSVVAGCIPNQDESNIANIVKKPGEDFVTMMYRFMDEKGINKASTLYKKAGISKSAYSKLISGGSKKPSRETAVGLAMALKLTYDETVEFLASAGLALSNSDTFDIIVTYFIKTGNYDIWQLDVQLVKYGCKALLGC